MQKKYYDGAQVCKILGECIEDHKTYLRVLNAFAEELSSDVVEVVRCKDCKFQGHIQLCPFGKRSMPHANGYCCYGERRDDG